MATVKWLKTSPSPSFTKGLSLVNQLEETKFEQFLKRIVSKVLAQETEIFSVDERQKLEKIFKTSDEDLTLAIQATTYLCKRMLKFIFMPANLKADLKLIGLSDSKAEVFVKVWSSETRSTLNDLSSEVLDKQGDSLNFSWKLNAELSSDINKISKIPKAYISISSKNGANEMELTHQELYSMFMQFEDIQQELDEFIDVMKKKSVQTIAIADPNMK